MQVASESTLKHRLSCVQCPEWLQVVVGAARCGNRSSLFFFVPLSCFQPLLTAIVVVADF